MDDVTRDLKPYEKTGPLCVRLVLYVRNPLSFAKNLVRSLIHSFFFCFVFCFLFCGHALTVFGDA